MAYDEIEYWNNRREPNSKSKKEAPEEFIHYIRTHIAGARTCLDVGPGVGRMANAYQDGPILDLCDVAAQHGYELMEAYHHTKFNFTLLGKVGVLPYKDNEFDVVTCTQVMLHQRPTLAIKLMREMIRVGRKVVIISFQTGDPVRLAPHCFNHDYLKICKDNNWATKYVIHRPNQILFTYTEEV